MTASHRETFWRELFSRHENSNFTIGETCARAGVSTASFFAWRKRLREVASSRATGPLVPVRVVEDRNHAITIELVDGVRVQVPQGADRLTLVAVLRAIDDAARREATC